MSDEAPFSRGWLAAVKERIGHYLPDLVYGANDGIVTTFAVVSGGAGAEVSNRVILILGFASLLADAFSMGASNYLAMTSRVEEGPPNRLDALRHGFATFLMFLVVGSIPLVAYLAPLPDPSRFPYAIALTLLSLFGTGAARALVSPLPWLRSGLEMLVVGATASAVAYLIGALVAGLTGSAGNAVT